VRGDVDAGVDGCTAAEVHDLSAVAAAAAWAGCEGETRRYM
jgi:hypothetical protein